MVFITNNISPSPLSLFVTCCLAGGKRELFLICKLLMVCAAMAVNIKSQVYKSYIYYLDNEFANCDGIESIDHF